MHLVSTQTFKLAGNVTPPGSKSETIRALFFSLLAKGQSKIINFLNAEDVNTAIQVCRDLGAKIEIQNNQLLMVTSSGAPLQAATRLYTGNSGITTTFSLPLLGLRKNFSSLISLNCGKQMQARPIDPLIKALNSLGMEVKYTKNNCYPLTVAGQLQGGKAEIDGLSSQYLSALLISLPCANQESIITVKNLHERPYIQMTLDFLNLHGIQFEHQVSNNVDTFHILGMQQYHPLEYKINGDFSSASCLLTAAALINSNVEFYGLNYQDSQGDKRLIHILQTMGADISIEENKLKINSKKPLNGIRIDAHDIPDLVPALTVIGTQAQGKTDIYNVAQARLKETDRINALTVGLRKMGAQIEEYPDGMIIHQSKLKGSLVEGFNDHRTVMALAVAGMLAEGMTVVTDAGAIKKTFPGFINTLQALGANVNLHPLPHIILIGFKHVGKTSIGQCVANFLNKKFIDLDCEIEKNYNDLYSNTLTCREIMRLHGEDYFRILESQVLSKTLLHESSVISLGGGTVLTSHNQKIIKPHILLHIVAPKDIVFERILAAGYPAFFNSDEQNFHEFLNRLWEERDPIYQDLTQLTVDNGGLLEQAVNEALTHLGYKI